MDSFQTIKNSINLHNVSGWNHSRSPFREKRTGPKKAPRRKNETKSEREHSRPCMKQQIQLQVKTSSRTWRSWLPLLLSLGCRRERERERERERDGRKHYTKGMSMLGLFARSGAWILCGYPFNFLDAPSLDTWPNTSKSQMEWTHHVSSYELDTS